MTVLTTVGFGDVFPTTRPGQALASTWGVFSVILTAIFTSLITSDFQSTLSTQSALLDSLISLDASSYACIEKDVAALDDWITYSLDPVIRRDFKRLGECVEGVQNGLYTVAISDAPRLTWYANFYNLDNAHVSPALTFSPFAYAFNNDDQARERQEYASVCDTTHLARALTALALGSCDADLTGTCIREIVRKKK